MLGSLILYLEAMRIMMFQLSGFYYTAEDSIRLGQKRSYKSFQQNQETGTATNETPQIATRTPENPIEQNTNPRKHNIITEKACKTQQNNTKAYKNKPTE